VGSEKKQWRKIKIKPIQLPPAGREVKAASDNQLRT